MQNSDTSLSLRHLSQNSWDDIIYHRFKIVNLDDSIYRIRPISNSFLTDGKFVYQGLDGLCVAHPFIYQTQ